MTQERVKQLEWEVEKLQQYRKEAGIDLSGLSEEFGPEDLEWRVQRSGIGKNGPWAIIVPFVSARAIMDRLDLVVGPHNWQNSHHITDKGVLTTISIKINGEWVFKMDGAEFTDIESFKGGLSGGLKRSAVAWGIGRSLYSMPTTFAKFVDRAEAKSLGGHSVKIEGQEYYWVAPQ